MSLDSPESRRGALIGKLVMCLLFAGASTATPAADSAAQPPITVASYYFGNYHPGDPRIEQIKGKGWSEWELLKATKPRFPGHEQPKVPLWGYGDESNPLVMARKIDAAADHGIDAFIFDWYYYNDGPFLQDTIDEGYLQAPNRARVKFALMWANHDWLEIHPLQASGEPKLHFPGAVTPQTFAKMTEHVIKDYFLRPSYWRVEGKPYFSIYELTELVRSFGSVEATRAALDAFRAAAVKAGLPGLHLNAVVWGEPTLPGQSTPADVPKLIKDLGFDSVTSYVWVHHAMLPRLKTDYAQVRKQYFAYWDKARQMFDVPYIPNVTMGWDGSPRHYEAKGDWGGNVITGNTPARFREALQMTKQRLLARPGLRIVNINCWNEWTEGSYLEPDTVHRMAYLDAVRDVFGSARGHLQGARP